MKPDYWQRLAQAARLAPARPAPPMPFGFDTRVLANWRAQRNRGEGLPWVFLLRAGVVGAALIMLVSLALNYQALQEEEPSARALANSAIQISMVP
ncbi:MAG: hypothetical protein HY674_16260 [Chloroflexi bacterium]|nr:hypothetical protein [Chloroflexota bacterium]